MRVSVPRFAFSTVALLASLATATAVEAQQPPPAAPASAGTPDAYAKESFVIERLDALYVMNADGTGYRQRTVVVKVQSDPALREFGVVNLPFASASEHVEFHYIRVRRPDGTVTETPLTDAIEQPAEVTREAPFYSDLKQEQVPVKNLRVGDTVEWEARVVRTKSEAPGEFWGDETFPDPTELVVRQSSVELRMPRGKAATVWTNPAAGVQPSDSTVGEQRVVRWEWANLRPTTGTEADAAKAAKKKKRLTAEEELDAEQGKLPSVAWTTFPSWAAVGAWYRGLEDDRAAPNAEIKARVAELTAGKTTEEEKVRAVYAYVSTQIRYIGVALGLGRYQPHHAEDVLSNQYGDCKNKETLLASMLAVLGIRADAVLIGAGVRFNPAVPSPAAFNHLIARITLDGKPVWMDATEEVAPFRMLAAPIRDKQALLVPDAGLAAIVQTPADPPFPNLQEWEASGSLDAGGTSNSHIKITFRGDGELFLRTVVRSVPPAQYDDLAQKLLNGLGYAGTSNHAEFSRADDTTGPLTLSMDYHREKGGDWDNLRVIPQLAPVTLPAFDDADPPIASIALSGPRTEHSTASLTLPPGWTAELPEAVHEKTAFATYDLTYRFDKGTLYSERKLVVLQRKLPASDWKTYKKFQDAIDLGKETYVQLARARSTVPESGVSAAGGSSSGKGGESASSISAVPGSSGESSHAAAAKLLSDARNASQREDFPAAQALVDQAKQIDSSLTGIWSESGYIALQYGKINEAIADFRKELELHPQFVAVWKAIVAAQLSQRNNGAAEESLRSWTAADPGDPEPPTRLASMLTAEGKPAEAAEVASAAVARLPEERRTNEALQLALGSAQVKSGQKEKGAATLVTLLKTTENSLVLNDAAYALANANLELPTADASERTALGKLDAETQSWTLDEAPARLRHQTNLLVASWDTMGWILFREGKPREARSYVSAAYLNNQHAEVKSHLDQINAALSGKSDSPNKASSASTSVPVSGLPLARAGVASHDQRSTEQAARTLPLGPSGGRHGVAEYRLLLAHGRVEKAEPTGAKSVEGADTLLHDASVNQLFPEHSDAKLVRTAMLNCVADHCELVLEP